MERQKIQNSLLNIKEGEQSQRTDTIDTWFQNYNRGTIIKKVWYWQKNGSSFI